jgi:hypothetical protein
MAECPQVTVSWSWLRDPAARARLAALLFQPQHPNTGTSDDA